MENSPIIATIDAEIAKLQQAKALLTGTELKKKLGRPKKVVTIAVPQKRTMSVEARKKIAAAQKARWAKAKKTA